LKISLCQTIIGVTFNQSKTISQLSFGFVFIQSRTYNIRDSM